MNMPLNALRQTLMALLVCGAGSQTLMAAEPACPSDDLPTFVKAFAVSPELQKAYTASPLIEQRTAYGEQGYAVTTRHKLPDSNRQALAILDPQAQAKAGLKTFWEDQTLVVHDELGDFLRAFVFKKNTCWTLAQVEEWSVQALLDEKAPAHETAVQREMRKASLYEGFGAIEQYPLTVYFFELAQRIDLHAAERGSAAGAVRAVVLGYSGMSPALAPAQIETLLTTYADTDAEARLLLGDFYCTQGDQSSERPCLEPRKAEETVLQAARQFDSASAYSALAYNYSEGKWGPADVPRALACYREAVDRGDIHSLHPLAWFAKRGQTPQPGSRCL